MRHQSLNKEVSSHLSDSRYDFAFQDEIMPWDCEPPQQASHVSEESNIQQPCQADEQNFNAQNSDTSSPNRLPIGCKWIENTPYPVLQISKPQYGFFIAGLIMVGILIVSFNLGFKGDVNMTSSFFIFLLFVIVGILMLFTGILMILTKTTITFTEQMLDIKRGVLGIGIQKIMPNQNIIIRYYSEGTINGRKVYNVELIDPYSNQSIIVADRFTEFNADKLSIYINFILQNKCVIQKN